MNRNGIFKIKDYMTANPVTVDASSSIEEAFTLMQDCGLRHLPVLSENRLVGVLSERDIAMAWGKSTEEIPTVAEAMTSAPYVVSLDSQMSDILSIMAANRLGCVLVKDHGEKVCGIFTTTDATQLLSEVFLAS